MTGLGKFNYSIFFRFLGYLNSYKVITLFFIGQLSTVI